MSLCNKSKDERVAKSKPEAKPISERWAEGKVNDFSVVKRKGRPRKK